MTTVAESQLGKHQLASTLEDGVEQISERQSVTFKRYVRCILPLDGSVFWVLSGPALQFKGSFHYVTNQGQNEDESNSINQVVFTAEEEVHDLNEVESDVMYIGIFDDIEFSFSQRKSFYKQSSLFHYTGNAVYAVMKAQVIDTLGALLENQPVVSNSLPIWLTLDKYAKLYPSYLVDQNTVPPYASVHVIPDQTTALQAVPALNPVFETVNGDIKLPLNVIASTHSQLVRDKVKITLWGLRNDQALGFVDYVLGHMANFDDIGLMNMPVIRDEKKTQVELNIIGQKKTVEFEVSYYQSRAYECARQLILSAVPTYLIGA